MSLVVVGAALTFAVALVFIVRELRARPTSGLGGAPVPSSPRDLFREADVDVTKVGRGPGRRAKSSAGIPQIHVHDEDSEASPTTQSALTLYENDSRLDEPTGPFELILVHSVGQTDQGKRRRRNEDSYLVMPAHGVFAVADGMGGYAGGDVASNLAVDTIRTSFETNAMCGEPDPRRPFRGNELVWTIEAANRAIFQSARENDEFEGMGTTLVAARFSPRKQRVYIAHVGDSRCYRRRDGKLTQLTADHTLGAVGISGPYATHLRRALGIKERVKIDLVVDVPRAGDRYLLCSDGLSKMVSDSAINEIVGWEESPDVAVEKLVSLANARGGKDNITVILVSVLPASGGKGTLPRKD